MTREEKKKKAISIAVAYYLEQERNDLLEQYNLSGSEWVNTVNREKMLSRILVQRRGRMLRNDF